MRGEYGERVHGGRLRAGAADAAVRLSAADARRALVRVDDLPERLPERVFVLAVPPEGDRPAGVELRRTARNEVAVVAYSSIQLLAAACGSGQPWIQVPRERLAGFCAEAGVGVVVLDAVVDPVPRYPDAPEGREQPPLDLVDPVGEQGGCLYVPSRPVRAGQRVVELELQPDAAGRLLLLAYTSPALLAAGCGGFQPWAAVRADAIAGVAVQAGARGVLLNPVLDESARHAGPVRDWNSRSAAGED
ncbi:hypothetical protein CU254_41200 (plasmid) [Amycolatopsis sp. AA4]|nr:hypothetical protein CU254_41200 [Amycolatopsis sp. AA4]